MEKNRDPGWSATLLVCKYNEASELSLYKWPLQKSLDAISATGRQKLEMNISKKPFRRWKKVIDPTG
jgi:hypothetical protein